MCKGLHRGGTRSRTGLSKIRIDPVATMHRTYSTPGKILSLVGGNFGAVLPLDDLVPGGALLAVRQGGDEELCPIVLRVTSCRTSLHPYLSSRLWLRTSSKTWSAWRHHQPESWREHKAFPPT